MSPLSMFSRWLDTVKWLFPDLHGPTQKALAAFSFGLAMALDCRLSVAALEVVTSAKVQSVIRRFERLLSNDRLSVSSGSAGLARRVLADWNGSRIELLLDETALSNDLKCLKLSVRYRGRALPLLWKCYPPKVPPLPMPQLIAVLLQQLVPLLPPRCQPILLCDRGLSWPQVLDAARALGLSFLLRLQKEVRVRLPEGTEPSSERTVESLLNDGAVPVFTGEAEIFKDAGWRRVNLVLVWQSPPQEPWLLATDLPADRRVCGMYRRRMRQEEAFRDDKSSGFDWHKSRVRNPQHAERLLLAMALATLWITSIGSWVVKRGLRTQLEPHKRRLYSVFGLGWRFLHLALRRGIPLTARLVFSPPLLSSLLPLPP